MKRNNRGLLSCRRCGWKYTKLSKLPAYIKKTTIICFATLIQRLEIKPNKLFYASTFFFPILPVYLSLLYCFLSFFFFPSFKVCIQKIRRKKYTQFRILRSKVVISSKNFSMKHQFRTRSSNVESASYQPRQTNSMFSIFFFRHTKNIGRVVQLLPALLKCSQGRITGIFSWRFHLYFIRYAFAISRL